MNNMSIAQADIEKLWVIKDIAKRIQWYKDNVIESKTNTAER